jgi:hypothetical protein
MKILDTNSGIPDPKESDCMKEMTKEHFYSVSLKERTLIAVVVWFFYETCETWFLTWEEGVEDIWT